MSRQTLLLMVSVALLTGCASTRERPSAALMASTPPTPRAESAAPRPAVQESHAELFDGIGEQKRSSLAWAPGQPLMHGFLGVTSFTRVEIEDASVDGDEGDADELPLIGGGAQWKLGGKRVDFGLEGLLSFAGRANAEAFVIGGGGAAVAIDVDMLVFELYGGPFASLFLGEKVRLYGALGPLLQWVDYEQTGNGLANDGSGTGYGYYGRTGIEFALPSRTLVGMGVRWSDSSVDLGSDLGDLELEGLQILFTVSRGL